MANFAGTGLQTYFPLLRNIPAEKETNASFDEGKSH